MSASIAKPQSQGNGELNTISNMSASIEKTTELRKRRTYHGGSTRALPRGLSRERGSIDEISDKAYVITNVPDVYDIIDYKLHDLSISYLEICRTLLSAIVEDMNMVDVKDKITDVNEPSMYLFLKKLPSTPVVSWKEVELPSDEESTNAESGDIQDVMIKVLATYVRQAS